MVAGAAELRRVKRRARALARHHRTGLVGNLQLRRAVTVQVRNAPRVLAVTGSSGCPYPHTDIVTVNEAHVVEVLVAAGASDRELRQRHRGSASTGAPEPAGAVSGGAFPVAGSIEGAAGSGPEPPRPAGGSGELKRRPRREGESAVSEKGGPVAGKSPRPDRVGATVFEGKNSA